MTARARFEAVPHPQPERRSGPRLRIFNVKYSPNLGDGLLSECLEQALIECGAHPDTWSIDLAGRAAYGPGSAGRSALIGALHALPAPARALAVRLPLAVQTRRRWRPHYRTSLEHADCVVIGGGNLVADLDLNFPTKIALAIEEAERRGLPAFLYGCGVSAGWSPRGTALMRRALGRGVVRKVFVRDDRSRRLWDAMLGTETNLPAAIVRDPGLLTAHRYCLNPPKPRRAGEQPRVGLNITSPAAVRYHAQDAPDTGGLDGWYLDVLRGLIARGSRVTVFTNGSPEDRACAAQLRCAFEAIGTGGPVSFTEPHNPEELARLISGLDGLIAFRMHAVIAAWSCKVPFVALRWDAKLDAFVQSVHRADWLLDPADTPASPAIEALERAMALGFDPADHARITAEARAGVAALYDEILRAVPHPGR